MWGEGREDQRPGHRGGGCVTGPRHRNYGIGLVAWFGEDCKCPDLNDLRTPKKLSESTFVEERSQVSRPKASVAT